MGRFVYAVAPSLVFVLGTLGCTTTTDSSALPTTTAITSIYLDPSFFMGDMVCSATSGAIQSYVAHIYDVTKELEVALPATPPVSCSAGVTFQQVVVDHKYRIKIDGYDLPASELLPLGGMTSGSRTMVLKSDPDAGAVTPHWATHCDDVTAVKDTRVNASSCTPFPEVTAQVTGVRIDARVAMKSATPALTCQKTVGPDGDVYSLNVRPDDPSLPAFLYLSCADEAPAPPAFTQGITAGQTYGFRIEATASFGGPVIWGSSCAAIATDGLIVEAKCDPLRKDGAMDVVIDADTCSKTNTVTYDVEYAGTPKESIMAVSCGKSVRISPLDAGMQAATVVGYRADGSVSLEATCSAKVQPGLVSEATCMFF